MDPLRTVFRLAPLPAFCLILASPVSAIEQAYPKTPVGEIEVKTLPAATLIASRSEKGYFEEDNRLFRPLFRYIQKRDIAMTTPVEAEMEPGEMFFYIGEAVDAEALADTGEVAVRRLPERTVASIGARGGYSEANFAQARKKLEDWLASQPRYEATGPARGVFWDGPFTLWFLKRFEVHVPVREVGGGSAHGFSDSDD